MFSLLLVTHIIAHHKISFIDSLYQPYLLHTSDCTPPASFLLLMSALYNIYHSLLYSLLFVYLYIDPQITQVYSLNLCLP